jgi:hypothetical protein
VWGKKRHTERQLSTRLVTTPTAFLSTSVLGSVLLIHAWYDVVTNPTTFLSTAVLGEVTADNTEWSGFFGPGRS